MGLGLVHSNTVHQGQGSSAWGSARGEKTIAALLPAVGFEGQTQKSPLLRAFYLSVRMKSGLGGAQLERKLTQHADATVFSAVTPGLQISQQLFTAARGVQPELAQLFTHGDHLVQYR